MKKFATLFWLTLLLIPITAKSNTTNWMTSFEDAQKLSKLVNKPILIDFWATWCGPCKKMDSDVWSKEDIKIIMKNFIPVKIDIDSNSLLASKYYVRSIPNVMILDSWGNVLESFKGYRDKNFVSEVLTSYSLNLTSINQALFILDKDDENVFSNLRVAQKFLDASFVLEGNPKFSFLRRSSAYLKNASKKTSKSDIILNEKIDLLELLNKAYSTSYKSSLKKLEDFSNIDESNKALFYYIKFYCCYFLNLNDEMNAAQKELVNTSGNESFVQKIDYLMSKN